MFSFFKKKSNRKTIWKIPFWSKFDDAGKFRRFIDTALEYTDQHKAIMDIDNGWVYFEYKTPRDIKVDLGRIDSICAEKPKTEWVEAIENYFGEEREFQIEQVLQKERDLSGSKDDGEESVSEIPSWSSFESRERFWHFANLLRAEAEKYGANLNLEIGEVRLERDEDKEHILQLRNLDLACKEAKIDDVSLNVEKLFATIFTDFVHEEPTLLCVRILPEITHGGYRFDGIGYKVAEDLFCYVVDDTPDRTTNLSRNYLEKSGMTEEDLIQLGIKNSFEHKELVVKNLTGNFYAVYEEYYYAPNVILDLKRFPEVLGKYGAIVAPCNGSSTYILKVSDGSVVDEFTKLVQIAVESYIEKSNRVSPNLYWYQPDGSFLFFPFNREESSIGVSPEAFQKFQEIMHAENG